MEDSNWQLYNGEDQETLLFQPNTEVIGLSNWTPGMQGPGLVFIQNNRLQIDIINGKQTISMPQHSQIIQAIFDPSYLQCTYIMKNNEIKGYSFLQKEFLLSIESQADVKLNS